MPVQIDGIVVEAAAQLRADLYLMGVTGVHAEAGLTTGDFEEAAVKRAMQRAGFRMAARLQRGDWAILWLRRRRTR